MGDNQRCPLFKVSCLKNSCAWYIQKDVRGKDKPGECAITKIAEHLYLISMKH